MGLQRHLRWYGTTPPAIPCSLRYSWQPDLRDAQAMEVVDRMLRLGFRFMMEAGGGYRFASHSNAIRSPLASITTIAESPSCGRPWAPPQGTMPRNGPATPPTFGYEKCHSGRVFGRRAARHSVKTGAPCRLRLWGHPGVPASCTRSWSLQSPTSSPLHRNRVRFGGTHARGLVPGHVAMHLKTRQSAIPEVST